MSIPKLQLAPQPQTQAEIIHHAPDTLDFTGAIIVNRHQLAEAMKDARYVSAVLRNIENLDDLDWHEMTDLCRTAYRTVQLLAAILDRKETFTEKVLNAPPLAVGMDEPSWVRVRCPRAR